MEYDILIYIVGLLQGIFLGWDFRKTDIDYYKSLNESYEEIIEDCGEENKKLKDLVIELDDKLNKEEL